VASNSRISLKCPHCRKELDGIAQRLAQLMDETKRMRSALRRHDRDTDCEVGVVFVASESRPHFHRPNCKWAQYITRPRLQEFFSHKEAVDSGYKPCKTCKA
jgi:methylphosphotriester-DNA--protein-cysteine methyltransferase